MNTVPQMLRNAAAVYEQRNKEYGDNYKLFGYWANELMINMSVKTPHDMNRFALLFHIATKLSRYVTTFNKGGHEDSLTDIAVYATMLREIDAEGPRDFQKTTSDDFHVPEELAERLKLFGEAPDGSVLTKDGQIVNPGNFIASSHDLIIKAERGDTFNVTVDDDMFDSLLEGRAYIGMEPGKGIVVTLVNKEATFDVKLEGDEAPASIELTASGPITELRHTSMDTEIDNQVRCVCGHLRGAHRFGHSEQEFENAANGVMTEVPERRFHECVDKSCGCKKFAVVTKQELGLNND